MSPKKISSILSLIEIAENNLKNARDILSQLAKDSGISESRLRTSSVNKVVNNDESGALEVVEGYFDGESMIGDNGKTYPVPPNYASKTQLIIGDRMKWILTSERESFKLIKPAERERVIGTFGIEGNVFYVAVEGIEHPIRILKASATFAMKNFGMQIGDRVAVIIPRDNTPTWGALSSVVSSEEEAAAAAEHQSYQEQEEDSEEEYQEEVYNGPQEIEELQDYNVNEEASAEDENQYF